MHGIDKKKKKKSGPDRSHLGQIPRSTRIVLDTKVDRYTFFGEVGTENAARSNVVLLLTIFLDMNGKPTPR